MFRDTFHLTSNSAPPGLKWRSSVWFVTLVVGAGVTTDVFFYAIIIPVIPFRLETLGYKHPSSLTGYLLLSYAAGLVLSTPPITWLSEHFNSRRTFLIIGLLGFIGAQVLFMLSPVYWALVVSRIIQGISSTIVWTIGCALLGDVVPEERIGQQFGIALSGFAFGSGIAPTIGGALYSSFGFRAPFIASLILLAFDLVLRVLVIERKDALKWGFDPMTAYIGAMTNEESNEKTKNVNQGIEISTGLENKESISERNTNHSHPNSKSNSAVKEGIQFQSTAPKIATSAHHRNSFLSILTILKSKRAAAAAFAMLMYGFVIGMLEPTIPLRFQNLYGYTSLKVGLVFMGATLPTIISSAVAGILCDKYGTGLINTVCFLLTLPWPLIMAIHGPVALFIVTIILFYFFCGTIPAPAMAELAGVARDMEGIGYAHFYGLFNLAFGIGTAIGPLVGGQLYDHVHNGFTVIQGLSTFFLLLAMAFAVTWMEERPLLMRITSRLTTHVRLSADSSKDREPSDSALII